MNKFIEDLSFTEVVILGVLANAPADQIQQVLHAKGCMIPLEDLLEVMAEMSQAIDEKAVVVEVHHTQIVLH